MPDEYKSISIGPLSGVLDNRSMPEQMASGNVRLRDNFKINASGRMGRQEGWQKFLSSLTCYNNADLHDQMLPAQIFYSNLDPVADGADEVRIYPPGDVCATDQSLRTQGREYPTLLFQAVSTSGQRYWIVGTQSRLYELNVATGAYRLLGDGWGGPTTSGTLMTRFRAGQVKDTIIFTNNVDAPFSYTLGDEIAGCLMRATREIPDLSLIKLTAAADVIAFKGHALLFNVVMDGSRIENRYLWTDFMLGAGSLHELVPGQATAKKNDPRSARANVSFDPAVTDTIAGYDSLPSGHRILRAIEFNQRILIFTNKGIFASDKTGSADKAFASSVLYQQSDGARCLSYPNMIVSTGKEIYYAGRDAIYKWDSFTIEPEREEWLHRGTGRMFSGFNSAACETHCAGYSTHTGADGKEEREVWFSYAESGHDVPNKTLTVQPEQRFVSPLDAGFTAFGNCTPDTRLSIDDFLRTVCACTSAELAQEAIKAGAAICSPVCDAQATALCATPSIGDNIAEGSYDSENGFHFDLIIGQTYLWTQGENDVAIYDGIPAEDGQSLTESGTFIAGFDHGFASGVAGNSPITFTLKPVSGVAVIPGTDILVQDFNAVCEDGSLCDLLDGKKLDDFCLSCEGKPLFVGASSRDKSLKQIGDSFSREFCLNSESGNGSLNGLTYNNFTGLYAYEGYYSHLIIGPHPIGDKGIEKNIRNVMLEMEAMPELNRNVIAFRIGYAWSPLDPISDNCQVVWTDYERRELLCPQSMSSDAYRKKNLRPNFGVEWRVFRTARFFFFDFLVSGLRNQNDLKSDLVPPLGAESYFSSFVIDVRKA